MLTKWAKLTFNLRLLCPCPESQFLEGWSNWHFQKWLPPLGPIPGYSLDSWALWNRGPGCLRPVFQYVDWQRQEEGGHCPVQPRKEYKKVWTFYIWGSFWASLLILSIENLFWTDIITGRRNALTLEGLRKHKQEKSFINFLVSCLQNQCIIKKKQLK